MAAPAQPANRGLEEARRAKKDEFYTQLADIERELRHYKAQFKDKVVAVPLLLSARSQFERIGDLESVLDAENGLAVAYIGLGRLDDAKKSAQREEEISTRFSFLSRRACALVNQAEIEFARSRLDEASRYLSMAEEDFLASEDLSEIWTAFMLRGVMRRELGDFAASTEHFRRALKSPAIWSESDRRLAIAEMSESLLHSGRRTAARKAATLVGPGDRGVDDWARILASAVTARSTTQHPESLGDELLCTYSLPNSVPTRVEHAMAIVRLGISGPKAREALEHGADAAHRLGDRRRFGLLRSALDESV